MSTTTTETFMTYATAKNDRDLETAMSVWHPDAILEIPAAELTFEGRDQARTFFSQFLDAIDGYHGEVMNLAVDGDTVVADWVLHGALTGELLGFDPTGAELELPMLSIAEIRDGVFESEALRFDLASLARQAQLPLTQVLDLLDLPQESTPTTRDRHDTTTDLKPSRRPDSVNDRAGVLPAGGEEFLDVFIEGWEAPQPLDQFLDHFLPHVHPDVRLRQPLGTEHGHDGFERVFRRLFTLMPDVHGEVQETSPRRDGLLIVLGMRGTLGGSSYEWTIVDRITLQDGQLIDRQAHFDPLPLFAAIARRPSAWPQALRSLLMT